MSHGDPLIRRSRELRKTGSDAERALWKLLRSRQMGGAKFRRQQPFGAYILDFFCLAHRLAIEADGGSHFTDEGREHDGLRTEFLESHGIRVIRFTNREILLEPDAVQAAIWRALKAPQDRPSP